MIPAEANLAPHSIDLLRRLITDADDRLGKNGVEEIKAHAFFNGFDWENVRKTVAPYQPTVTSEISNENFDHFEEEEPFHPTEE